MGDSSAEGEVDRHEMLVGQSLAWLGRNVSICLVADRNEKTPMWRLLSGGHFRLLGVLRPFPIAEEGVRERETRPNKLTCLQMSLRQNKGLAIGLFSAKDGDQGHSGPSEGQQSKRGTAV